ncbi:hypothetical protein BAUCODRAFT_118452 [Baudoinia panamericana UAMH 10762]|uniref:Uncharacterized protein n=1 Tax=Baudoinia panamericana (strain UAMH 10762) TaxID=717646 RepID=M2NN98_BAUPA|nr:uncharacterized protein BAUCODRAFT_118452 [Baudoinia panamericana UAMH 10762]EMD00706.1 hypothetical protein BAUCODRAFT_118452 [Baudoinia panamericana UAMH 10762]
MDFDSAPGTILEASATYKNSASARDGQFRLVHACISEFSRPGYASDNTIVDRSKSNVQQLVYTLQYEQTAVQLHDRSQLVA